MSGGEYDDRRSASRRRQQPPTPTACRHLHPGGPTGAGIDVHPSRVARPNRIPS